MCVKLHMFNALHPHHLIAQTSEPQPSKHLTTLNKTYCYALWLSWSVDQYVFKNDKNFDSYNVVVDLFCRSSR